MRTRERRRKWQNELCWWCSGSTALSQYRFSSSFSRSPPTIVYILWRGTISLNFIIPATYFNSHRRMFICANSLRELLLLSRILFSLASVLHRMLLGKAMNGARERVSKGTATWRPFIRHSPTTRTLRTCDNEHMFTCRCVYLLRPLTLVHSVRSRTSLKGAGGRHSIANWVTDERSIGVRTYG